MNKIKLNKNISIDSVNKDSFVDLNISNTSKIIPETNIDEIINSFDQSIKERNECNIFRISSTINPLFTNILTNITGPDSLGSFNESRFRDKTSPVNASLELKDNISFKQSISTHLVKKDGWLGYYNPLLLTNDCKLIDLYPKRNDLNLLVDGGVKNWDMCISYPFDKIIPNILSNGLPIISKTNVEYNGRNMVRFSSPFNHGLVTGDKVSIFGLSDSNLDGEYFVYKTGLHNGDGKQNYFVVDLPQTIGITSTTAVSRLVNNEKSKYYYRLFKKIKTKVSLEMEKDDYEIFQMGFANNIFNDSILQVSFNEDIDITNLTDNLKRPILEFYFTIIKKGNNNMFSKVKSGFDLNFIDEVNNNLIPDIRKINNNITSLMTSLELDVKIDNNTFIGDIVEFNKFELKEIVLNDVNHRFNTNNRDLGGVINIGGTNLDMGKRLEGYMYKPHHKIQIRELSNFIEQGDISTINIPEYAVDLGDGRFLWRDVLDFSNSTDLKIPFLNGSHYINRYINLFLKRQDPFGLYGLFYNTFPRDSVGELNDDVGIKNNSDYEC